MWSNLSLLAFGFTNLAMLGWLGAAAAPLLIHLWSRHRFRETSWAAMQFLLAAMRKNARRLQLQQWLLLAVRTLIIVLVVLAVAEPYGERLFAGASSAPTHRVLVIDGSFSMAYLEGSESNFDRAKRLAAGIVRTSDPADMFTVIVMSSSPRVVIGADVADHSAVIRQVESLTPSQTGADLPATLELILDTLREKPTQIVPDRKEVHFFTDLQRVTWEKVGVNGSLASHESQTDATSTFDSIANLAAVNVVDVAQPHLSNLAITNISTSKPLITTGRDVTFDVAIHNFSGESQSDCQVELLVDNAAVGERTLNIQPDAAAAARFTYRFPLAGPHIVTARVKSDHLEVDNSRHLAVDVRKEIRVLCISGREGAAKYLADALNPDPAANSEIQPVIISESDLADTRLDDVDCIFFCNVAQLSRNETERLTRFAAAGGGIVFFLGDRVVPDSYNAAGKTTRKPPQSLIPVRVGELATQVRFGVDPLEYRHPIVAPFRGRERAGLLTTPVHWYHRLQPDRERADVQVVATFSNGDPFIVSAPLGRGQTIVVATDGSLSSVDPATGEPWTAWPTWPSFLPLVRELLAFATSGSNEHAQQLVGTTLSGTIPSDAASPAFDLKLQIVRPDGKTVAISTQNVAGAQEWTYPKTDLSGIYTLRGLPNGKVQPFAVNVNTAESDLSKVDRQRLTKLLGNHGASGVSAEQAADVVAQSPWNQNLLWAAFVLLFVESLMAWQFGRGVV